MSNKNFTAEEIDQILPQTQCGLCDHGGCLPYAEAIVFENERIDKCPPGGVRVLKKLGEITGVDPSPFVKEMRQKQKPAQKVIVREDECIGCTKCIQACPVDAILGAAKKMHTVIASECTGCELCIEPCPMDCIDIVPSDELTEQNQLAFSNHNRKRFQFREKRLAKIAAEKNAKHKAAKVAARREAIKAAVARKKQLKGTE